MWRGCVSVAICVAIWVGLLAYSYGEPDSSIGKLIRMPFGFLIVTFGIFVLLTPIERYFKRRGKPLFIVEHDV